MRQTLGCVRLAIVAAISTIATVGLTRQTLDTYQAHFWNGPRHSEFIFAATRRSFSSVPLIQRLPDRLPLSRRWTGGQAVPVEEGRVRALADVLYLLEDAAGGRVTLLAVDWETHSCMTPLSEFQVRHRAISGLQNGDIVAIPTSSLAPAAVRSNGHLFWEDSTQEEVPGRAWPKVICRRYVADQTVLGALAVRRTFWVNLTGPTHNAIELMGKDVMQYAGWEQNTKQDAAIVIRGGISDEEVFEGTRVGEQTFLRHIYGSNVTNKDLLYWNLRSYLCQDRLERLCPRLLKIVPRTFLLDDPYDCADAMKMVQPSSGPGWVRKVGNLHMGVGVSMINRLSDEDRHHCKQLLERRSQPLSLPDELLQGTRVLYQQQVDGLQVFGRSTSIRVYMLVACFDPLVVFFNHAAGHVYIGGLPITSEMAWYTQHKTFSSMTFEEFDQYMLHHEGRSDFFHTYMQTEIRNSLRDVADTMDGLGRFKDPGPGFFDLLCADFMLSKDHKLYLLEVSDACMFKGYGAGQEQVRQRVYLLYDSLSLTVDVTSRMLQKLPLGPLLDKQLTAMDGRFELLHYSKGFESPVSSSTVDRPLGWWTASKSK